MYMADLMTRLLETARHRVRAGYVSERGLARVCGISQPHVHNVLKDCRALSTATADRLMRALEITIPELIWRRPEDVEVAVRSIPLIRQKIGPGSDANLKVFHGYAPFPSSLLAGLVEPVAARLGAEMVLPAPFAPNDLLLLDQNEALRAAPSGGGCWVVSDYSGLRIRYVRMGAGRVYLAHEGNVHEPKAWESVQLKGRHILDIVRARIVWIGRQVEWKDTQQAGPFGGLD
jgi:hypothetical protein